MNETIKTVLLALAILAAQALYMYLSSKNQLKSRWYLYILAIPLVSAVSVIMYSSSEYALNLYEYAVIICIFTAAVADVIYAARYNKDYMNDETACGFLYAYLMIVTAASWFVNASLPARIISAILLAASIIVFSFVKKHSLKELLKASVLTFFSVICSWSFMTFVL